MDNNSKSEKILISTTLFLAALVVGYNAFFVPCSEGNAIIETVSGSVSDNNNDKIENKDDSEVNVKPVGADNSKKDNEAIKSEDKTSKEEKGSKNIGGLVNINNAGVEELSNNLYRIGPKTAEKIIEYRQKNGGFANISEIKNVKGIGDKIFEEIKDKITVE